MDRPELFFSCVGGLGIDFDNIFKQLKEELAYFNYDLHKISLTSLLSEIPNLGEQLDPSIKPLINEKNEVIYSIESERVKNLTDVCNSLRETKKCSGILSLLAIYEIGRIRATNKSTRNAYFIISLKNPEEVDVFRKVYGNNFYLISIYATKQERHDRLIKLFTQVSVELAETEKIVDDYVKRDKKENLSYGQSVINTYPKACYFISLKNSSTDLNRMTRLIFGAPFITPTKDELAMACSLVMSMRSADLNRQVGSVITDSDGNILSAACNEVPKYGGGLYWPNNNDNRDHKYEVTNNIPYSENFKKQIAHNILTKIRDLIEFPEEQNDEFLLEAILKNTGLEDLIEFIRPVHAEEAAICDAARRGVSTKGAIIYTTSFPCHLCAKKIITVGIIERQLSLPVGDNYDCRF